MEKTELSILHNNQVNSQLLNAIENKFATPNSNVETFSPPKFSIPTLRSSPATGLTANSSSLNQFILRQLSIKRTNGEIDTTGGFALPALQIGANADNQSQQSNGATLEIPLLKGVSTIIKSRADITSISSDIDRLRVKDNDEVASSDIDLTMALSSTTTNVASASNRLLKLRGKANASVENFVIPFIDCDRRGKSVLLPITAADVYCQTDISNVGWCHTLMSPSSFGRIICLKYKRTNPLPGIDHRFKVKHKIKHFGFDTKSPDDVILATLNKYQR